MAIKQFTQSTPVLSAEASVGQEGCELTIEIRSFDFEDTSRYANYYGSRAQIEAEGLVPSEVTWPRRQATQRWVRDGLEWSLRRTRPEGMKGPMRQWIEGDYWQLRSDTPYRRISLEEREKMQAQRDLREAAHRLSAEYQQAQHRLRRSLVQLCQDAAYQKFRGKIAAFEATPRKARKPKTAEGV